MATQLGFIVCEAVRETLRIQFLSAKQPPGAGSITCLLSVGGRLKNSAKAMEPKRSRYGNRILAEV